VLSEQIEPMSGARSSSLEPSPSPGCATETQARASAPIIDYAYNSAPLLSPFAATCDALPGSGLYGVVYLTDGG